MSKIKKQQILTEIEANTRENQWSKFKKVAAKAERRRRGAS